MSAEKQPQIEIWKIKVAEAGLQGHQIKEVEINRGSKDPISEFVVKTLQFLDGKIENLSIPISQIKAYGGRRSSRELRDVRNQRAKELAKYSAAAQLLRGETNQAIKFSKDGDVILGFDIVPGNNGRKQVNP